MKKIIGLILAVCLCVGTVACGNGQTDKKDVKETTMSKKDTLVVYFSNTGNTKEIAEKIAEGTGADLFEIKAKKPYSDADLDYNDDNSRTTKEMKDASSRPEMERNVNDLSKYKMLYIGYPIWWGEAPRILDTFVEQNDFAGKIIIPFCTSGSSGIGSSADTLAELAKSGDWKEGKRFSGTESKDDVMKWAKQ